MYGYDTMRRPRPSRNLLHYTQLGDLTGWIALGGAVLARSASGGYGGAAGIQATCSATADGIQGTGASVADDVAGNTKYSFTADVIAAVGETVTLQWNEYDAGGSYLGIAHSANVVGNGAHQRVSVTATTHADCRKVICFAYSVSGAQVPVVSNIQFEAGLPTPFIPTSGASAARTAQKVLG